MTSQRIDAELGPVWPVVLTFGDQPPTEIGVVQAQTGPNGPALVIADLAQLLRDAANVMACGTDEAIALGRAALTAAAAGDFRRAGVDPALVAHDQEVLGRLAREVTGHAIAEARTLTPAEAKHLQHRADGGARLVAVAEDEEQEVVVSRGQLQGHCAHDVVLSAPCGMCDRG